MWGTQRGPKEKGWEWVKQLPVTVKSFGMECLQGFNVNVIILTSYVFEKNNMNKFQAEMSMRLWNNFRRKMIPKDPLLGVIFK